jgi:hypothetical protein
VAPPLPRPPILPFILLVDLFVVYGSSYIDFQVVLLFLRTLGREGLTPSPPHKKWIF